MERAQTGVQGTIFIEGIRRDPAVWTPVFTTIYEGRLNFHSISDPLADPDSAPPNLIDFAIEFDNERDTFFFICGAPTSVNHDKGELLLNVGTAIVEGYGLNSLDLPR